MENATPTVTIRVTLDSDRPYVTVSSTMPYTLEDEHLSEVVGLIRKLREEFAADYAAAVGESWPQRIGQLVPVDILIALLDEHELVDDVPFPIAKKWQDGYDSSGKALSTVYTERPDLCDWLWEKYLQRHDESMAFKDKLAFAALSLLRVEEGRNGDF